MQAPSAVEPAVGAILREYAISESLRENAIRLADINAVGGTGYTRRNFWTFLGAASFHVSSGAVASYRHYEPGADTRVAQPASSISPDAIKRIAHQSDYRRRSVPDATNIRGRLARRNAQK